jgi:hypothetical protein
MGSLVLSAFAAGVCSAWGVASLGVSFRCVFHPKPATHSDLKPASDSTRKTATPAGLIKMPSAHQS